jgi:cysteinyl-tRNA synthetase
MKIYNTLGRTPEPLQVRDSGRIAMYVCGPTVQARPHVGHGRAAVAFDVMRRYFEWLGYDVTYVQNVTDVEDKIIAAAAEQNRSTAEVATEAQAAFEQAYAALGVTEPTLAPKATDHIPEMIQMIESLVATGHAYEADGDVYFIVRSFPEYGKLSGRNIDELRSGARVDPGAHKRDPLDFAVWKATKPGEPSWDSPWGPGRPGWHIECSAMARKYLGVGFDIHAGGHDLVFPHHENEIAQAEAADGSLFARYWLHNGMVTLGGEKMAKSTGHVVDLLEAVELYPPLAVRLFYLRTHYRKPVEFTDETLRDATAQLDRLWTFRRRGGRDLEALPDGLSIDRFRSAMDDDFDVAAGLAVLFEVVREGNRQLDAGGDAGPWHAAYDEISGVLGIAEPEVDLADLAAPLTSLSERYETEPGTPTEMVQALVNARAQARTNQDWARSDEIRDELADLGIAIEDAADGARWHRR